MNLPVFIYATSSFILSLINYSESIRCPDVSVRYGRVKYRSRGRVAIFGCWAGFSLYGEKYAGCFRGAWDVSPPKCVRRGCSEVNFRLGTVAKPLYSTAVLSFKCFPGYSLMGPREIYCNGTLYDNLPPVCKREDTDMACDFEAQRLCKWRNDPTANLTFNLRQHATPSRVLNTGPSHDHTLDPEMEGYYLYLESSSTTPGEAARIFSPYLPHASDDSTCFKFWYHMFGSTIGALRVYINSTKHFDKTGNRGDKWRQGKVKLPSSGHFKIVVEAVTGSGYTGDIAIDDLDVGECTDDAGTTCYDRCLEDESDEFSNCDCHPGCADEMTCCPDYNHFCIAEKTTEVDESATSSSLITSTDLDQTIFDHTIVSEDIAHTEILLTDNNEELTTQSNYNDNLEDETTTYHRNDRSTIEPSKLTTEVVMLHNVTKDPAIQMTNKHIINHTEADQTNVIVTTLIPTLNTTVNDHKTTEIYFSQTTQTIQKLYSTTSRYNLRPRNQSTTNTMSSTTMKFIPYYNTTINPKLTTNKTTTSTMSVPFLNKSMSVSTLKTTKRSTHPTPTTTIRNKMTSISTKDPKITTPSTTNKIRVTVLKNDSILTSSTQVQMVTHNDKRTDVTQTIQDRVTHPDTTVFERRTPVAHIPVEMHTTRWNSKFKPKGAFHLIEEDKIETAGYHDLSGPFTAIIIIIVTASSALVIVFYLRKRRLYSYGLNDDAEIHFIPADEMLDFTSNTAKSRDSGVYNETVTSLKRER